MLREPALPASGAMDGGAQAASSERRPRRAVANSAGGTGDPEATFGPALALLVASLWAVHRRGRQKFLRFSEDLVTPQAFADPRLACAVARTLSLKRRLAPTAITKTPARRDSSPAGPVWHFWREISVGSRLLWQPARLDRRRRAGAGPHEGDEVGLLLIGELEGLDLVGKGGVGMAPLVVPLHHFLERGH